MKRNSTRRTPLPWCLAQHGRAQRQARSENGENWTAQAGMCTLICNDSRPAHPPTHPPSFFLFFPRGFGGRAGKERPRALLQRHSRAHCVSRRATGRRNAVVEGKRCPYKDGGGARRRWRGQCIASLTDETLGAFRPDDDDVCPLAQPHGLQRPRPPLARIEPRLQGTRRVKCRG